jgi:hypothetical protein
MERSEASAKVPPPTRKVRSPSAALGRRRYGRELEPRYWDVIRRRYERYAAITRRSA